MERYGVVDMGSNTIVLIIYEMHGHKPCIIERYSEPVHLIRYQQDGLMSDEGIRLASQVLDTYKAAAATAGAEHLAGFVTEPWRTIRNAPEMLTAFDSSGISITPLDGREEAELDFYGSRLDYPDIKDGNAFDIGGGSSEFISFRNSTIVEAASIPLGCVRLTANPLTDDEIQIQLNDLFTSCPLLASVPSATLIGIGGTVRAAAKLYEALTVGEGPGMSMTGLQTIDQRLRSGDKAMSALVKKKVSAGRQPVFPAGLHLVTAVMHQYHADRLLVSKGCVREGFLLKRMLVSKTDGH